jgi:hypothetical protein
MPLKLSPTQIAFNARGNGRFNKPFEQQLSFFRKKLNLPTERYDDILKQAHDRAFMVAGVQKADLLNDLRQAVDKAIAQGKSIGAFRKQFNNIVKQRGWQGWTGSDSQAGRDWRTRIIYRTNIATSYAAGRWKQLNDPDLLKSLPYWKYIHNDTVAHPRPLHVEWDGLVLKHDDPWWKTHFTPNGWGCRCRITAVREREFKGAKAPDNGVHAVVDSQGNKHVIPRGIDFGWDYAPGANTDTSLRELVQNKLINYQPAIARALSKDINNQIAQSAGIVEFAQASLKKASKEMLHLGFVENFIIIDNLLKPTKSLQGYLVLLPNQTVRHASKRHKFDGIKQRPVKAQDFDKVSAILAEPDKIKPGKVSVLGNQTLEVWKTIGKEQYRLVFEVFAGKKNRNMRLISMVIKTK